MCGQHYQLDASEGKILLKFLVIWKKYWPDIQEESNLLYFTFGLLEITYPI